MLLRPPARLPRELSIEGKWRWDVQRWYADFGICSIASAKPPRSHRAIEWDGATSSVDVQRD